MRLLDDPVEIGEGAEARIDPAIVGHIVAEILHRRGEEGRDPDAVDAQIGDVVEPLGDAGKIADPVTIGVAEGARVDLVDDRPAPPCERGVGGNSGVGKSGCHQSSDSRMQAAKPNAGSVTETAPGAASAAGQGPMRGATPRAA